MQLDPTKTLRELAIEVPGAARLFERLKIDYYCGANQPLADACERAGLNVQAVSRWLDAADKGSTRTNEPTPFQSLSLAELSAYIVNKP